MQLDSLEAFKILKLCKKLATIKHYLCETDAPKIKLLDIPECLSSYVAAAVEWRGVELKMDNLVTVHIEYKVYVSFPSRT